MQRRGRRAILKFSLLLLSDIPLPFVPLQSSLADAVSRAQANRRRAGPGRSGHKVKNKINKGSKT